MRYRVPFQSNDAKCVTQTLGGIDEVTVSVNNSQIIPVDSTNQFKLSYILGTATQVDVSTGGAGKSHIFCKINKF